MPRTSILTYLLLALLCVTCRTYEFCLSGQLTSVQIEGSKEQNQPLACCSASSCESLNDMFEPNSAVHDFRVFESDQEQSTLPTLQKRILVAGKFETTFGVYTGPIVMVEHGKVIAANSNIWLRGRQSFIRTFDITSTPGIFVLYGELYLNHSSDSTESQQPYTSALIDINSFRIFNATRNSITTSDTRTYSLYGYQRQVSVVANAPTNAKEAITIYVDGQAKYLHYVNILGKLMPIRYQSISCIIERIVLVAVLNQVPVELEVCVKLSDGRMFCGSLRFNDASHDVWMLFPFDYTTRYSSIMWETPTSKWQSDIVMFGGENVLDYYMFYNFSKVLLTGHVERLYWNRQLQDELPAILMRPEDETILTISSAVVVVTAIIGTAMLCMIAVMAAQTLYNMKRINTKLSMLSRIFSSGARVRKFAATLEQIIISMTEITIPIAFFTQAHIVSNFLNLSSIQTYSLVLMLHAQTASMYIFWSCVLWLMVITLLHSSTVQSFLNRNQKTKITLSLRLAEHFMLAFCIPIGIVLFTPPESSQNNHILSVILGLSHLPAIISLSMLLIRKIKLEHSLHRFAKVMLVTSVVSSILDIFVVGIPMLATEPTETTETLKTAALSVVLMLQLLFLAMIVHVKRKSVLWDSHSITYHWMRITALHLSAIVVVTLRFMDLLGGVYRAGIITMVKISTIVAGIVALLNFCYRNGEILFAVYSYMNFRRRLIYGELVTKPSSKSPRDERYEKLLDENSMADNTAIADLNKAIRNLSMSSSYIPFHQIDFVRRIAEGAFGIVYEAVWKTNGTPIAVKKLKNTDENPEVTTQFIQEASLLKSLRHPNIVMFLGVSVKDNDLYLITEFAAGGTLTDLLYRGTVLPWNRKVKMALDIARALLYLHRNTDPILHRDLKSKNVLLDSESNCRLCDFGLAKQLTSSSRNTNTANVGTIQYMAPEVLSEESSYNETCDIYSFGILMWEIYFQEQPFSEAPNIYVLPPLIIGGLRPALPSTLPDHVRLPVFPASHKPSNDVVSASRVEFRGSEYQLLFADGTALTVDSTPALQWYLCLMQQCWMHDPLARPSLLDAIAQLQKMFL